VRDPTVDNLTPAAARDAFQLFLTALTRQGQNQNPDHHYGVHAESKTINVAGKVTVFGGEMMENKAKTGYSMRVMSANGQTGIMFLTHGGAGVEAMKEATEGGVNVIVLDWQPSDFWRWLCNKPHEPVPLFVPLFAFSNASRRKMWPHPWYSRPPCLVTT